MSALDEQIGGLHYKGKKVQPVQLMAKLRMNAFQGNVFKYPSRFKDKNGLEDLNKTIHYIMLAKELKPENFAIFYDKDVKEYCSVNDVPDGFYDYIWALVNQDWDYCIEYVQNLIKENYA